MKHLHIPVCQGIYCNCSAQTRNTFLKKAAWMNSQGTGQRPDCTHGQISDAIPAGGNQTQKETQCAIPFIRRSRLGRAALGDRCQRWSLPEQESRDSWCLSIWWGDGVCTVKDDSSSRRRLGLSLFARLASIKITNGSPVSDFHLIEMNSRSIVLISHLINMELSLPL